MTNHGWLKPMVASVLLVGCSSSGDARTAPVDGATPSDRSSTDARDSSISGQSDAGDAGGPASSIIGWIQAAAITSTPSEYSDGLFAWFGASGPPPAWAGGPCTGSVAGACCIEPNVAGPASLSAGAIFVGSATPDNPIAVDGGVLYQGFYTTPSWPVGSELTIAAAGATIPAFSGQVYLPALPDMLTPDPGSSASALPRSSGSDITFTWQPGGVADARMLVEIVLGPVIICTADESGGTLTVPASLIAQLPDGVGSISAGPFTIADIDAGGSTVRLIGSSFSQGMLE
jgi:hypothetical protein